MTTPFRYPCTGHVDATGFGAFLERELGPPRANLQALTRELEQAFAVPHVTPTNSGSSANLAAALALAEVAGDRKHAITAGFTFPTTLSSLLAAGFSVTVVDTEPDGFGIDPAAVERALRPDTGLVCLTHFLGFPAAADRVASLAKARDLLVLQDACETMSPWIGGKSALEYGTLATWSFYHPHHLSSYGGGAVISPDERWLRRVESTVHWGRACTCHREGLACQAPAHAAEHAFHYVRPGHNLEMSELNACFGRWQLRSREAQETGRRARYLHLRALLRNVSGLRVYDAPEEGSSPFVFPVTVASGDAGPLVARLAARGAEARTLMGGPVTDQPAFRHVPDDGLASCRRIARASFFVGMHQTIAEEDVDAVGRILAEEARALAAEGGR